MQFKKDLVLETLTIIPDEITRGVDLTSKPASIRMLEQWAVKEVKQHKLNRIYILL